MHNKFLTLYDGLADIVWGKVAIHNERYHEEIVKH